MQSRAVEQVAAVVPRLAPQEPETRTRLPLFSGGMRTDKAPGDLAPNECAEIKGCHVVAGHLVVDTGYVPFGGVASVNGVYTGEAQQTFEAFFNDGTTIELLFTTQTVFKWVPGVPQWQLTQIDSRLVTAPVAAGVNIFPLDDVTGLTDGQLIGIALHNGQQLIATITNISSLNVTLGGFVPPGTQVDANAVVTIPPVLHGDPAVSQISVLIFPGNDWIIFCNGIDPVMYYYLGAVTVLPGLPFGTSCRAIGMFHELVLLGDTTEGGLRRPHRVRQSDAGDPTGWTPGTSGIAAIYDLLDSDDAILTLKVLGSWLIAYRENSIMRASYIGVLNECNCRNEK